VLVRIPLQLILIRSEPLKDNVVRSLREEVKLPFSLTLAQLPQNNTHPLPRARELEDVEELELDRSVVVRRLDAEDVLVATEEDESDVGGGLNESGFVGRLSLVREETVFFRGKDRVAEGKIAKEVVKVLGLVRFLLLKVDLDFGVVEGSDDTVRELGLGASVAVAVTAVAALLAVVGGYPGRGIVGRGAGERLLSRVRRRRNLVANVDLAVDGALTEEHRVLGKGTGLVGEDVFDLSEVVRQVPAASGSATAVSLHVVVSPDETGLDETSELDRNVEGDGDDVL
jgi:hypothetical protein